MSAFSVVVWISRCSRHLHKSRGTLFQTKQTKIVNIRSAVYIHAMPFTVKKLLTIILALIIGIAPVGSILAASGTFHVDSNAMPEMTRHAGMQHGDGNMTVQMKHDQPCQNCSSDCCKTSHCNTTTCGGCAVAIIISRNTIRFTDRHFDYSVSGTTLQPSSRLAEHFRPPRV